LAFGLPLSSLILFALYGGCWGSFACLVSSVQHDKKKISKAMCPTIRYPLFNFNTK